MTLICLTLAWLAGLYLAEAVAPAAPALGVLAATGVAGAALLVGPRHRLLVAGCLLAALLGEWRQYLAQPRIDEGHVAFYNDQGWVTVQGYISAEPSLRSTYVELEIRAEHLVTGDEAGAPSVERDVSGTLVAHVPPYRAYAYGDRVQASGLLETPPVLEAFDYRAYLASRRVHAVLRRPTVVVTGGVRGSTLLRSMYRLKDTLRRRLEALLPDPDAGLLTGIVLGLDYTLPDELYEAYRATGLAHLIVISGFNISLLSQMLLMLSRTGLRRWAWLWLNIGVVALYALLVEPTPPVTRAAIMGALAVLAQLAGRRASILTSLAATALVMTAVNPLLLGGASFQLSFASTLGLILLERPLGKAATALLDPLPGKARWPSWLRIARETALATVSAQVATLPILWTHFRQISLLALPANVLTVPLQPTIMVLGLAVTGLAGMGLLPVAQPLALLLWPLLRWTNLVVERLGRVPWAAIEVPPPSPLGLALLYGGGAAVVLALRHRLTLGDKVRAVIRGIGALRYSTMALALVVVVVWCAVFALPDGRLHLTLLDVGQGDAILIRTPEGRCLLVDGGPDPLLLSARLGRVLPFWQRRIDLVIATHGDSDHIAGLAPLLRRYRPSYLLQPPGMDPQTALGASWQQASLASGAEIGLATQGRRVQLGRGVQMEVLHPSANAGSEDDENRHSVVLRVEMGRFSALLTGDIDAQAEQALVAQGRIAPATVLKVAHHGAESGTSAPFLDAARPAIAVISVGADNRHGHPSPEVLQRLQEAGCDVYRTDVDGTIELVTDGTRCWVRTH